MLHVAGSGTIYLQNEKLETTFTEELIKRSIKVQQELLKKAISILKPIQEMVYSTCSILEEENEKQLKYFLEKKQIEIVPIDKKLLESIPLLPTSIEGTIAVCPTKLYEGFFVAKIKKCMI